MQNITRIVIKRYLGYFDEPKFSCNKVTITENSIAYEYVPQIEKSEIDYIPIEHQSESETTMDMYSERKWSYKTNSPIFKSIYNEIIKMIPEIFERKTGFYLDVGAIELIVTYSDKSKMSRDFYDNGDDLNDFFTVIKRLVPLTEQIPDVLLTSNDFEEDSDDED